MRVFCHEHKRGFFAPRQSPIKCENRGHVLGELDFSGAGKSPFQFEWQYCCNCEHFCVIDFDGEGLQRCPVCTRKTSALYVCDRCYTVSFESNTPLQAKNFTLTVEGAPHPCCPGCLQPASADLREHICEDARATFVTGLNSCPICEERLDIGPAFPSSVAQYLRRTRSANKANVTFDYETGLFVPVEDGEFVLINTNEETRQTIVLPRSPRLNSPREFYELYQDYYRCGAPDQGEITITEPAVVVPTPDGWKFLTPGAFVVINEQPKKPQMTVAPPPPLQEAGREEPRAVREEPRAVREEPRAVREEPRAGREEARLSRGEGTVCPRCETLIEAKYAFCWQCGYPRPEKNSSTESTPQQKLKSVPQRSRLIVSAIEEDEGGEITQQESRPGRSSWLTSENPKREARAGRSVLKLFAIPASGLLMLTLTMFVLTRSRSSETVANEAPQPTAQESAAPVQTPSVEIKNASLRTPTPEEDPALEQLKQLRRNGYAANPAKSLKSITETERKYVDDYRFPYERAKVVVIDHKRNFHKEAFNDLARAAQKAISKGKANEMLQSLNKDRDGDFQELSHGRREWTQLQKALKRKDANALGVNEGL